MSLKDPAPPAGDPSVVDYDIPYHALYAVHAWRRPSTREVLRRRQRPRQQSDRRHGHERRTDDAVNLAGKLVDSTVAPDPRCSTAIPASAQGAGDFVQAQTIQNKIARGKGPGIRR